MKKVENYAATVNSEHDFKNLNAQELDFIRTGPDTFHILRGNRRFEARLLELDARTKSFRFRINGSTYRVVLSDRFDQLVDSLGLAVQAGGNLTDVKAPMPGLVLQLPVQEGQQVAKGETLLILEAMKMENVIKSVGDATIKTIHVKEGSPVDKNQLLIEME